MTGYPGWRGYIPPMARERAEDFNMLAKAISEGAATRPNKYRNERTRVDGRWFDSKKEAARYAELLLLEKAGEIRDIACQVPFRLVVNGDLICTYRADFTYMTSAGERVVEDVKGVRTKEYILKAKLMKACHGIVIHEL